MALLPWYKWFQGDWLTSETRFGMTLAERGLYRDLLDIHYSEGSIPADERKLRAMVGAHKGFARAWAQVQKYFEPSPSDPTRLINKRAAQVIENRMDKGESSRRNGALGGRPPGPAKEPTRLSPGSEKKPLARAVDTESESDTDIEEKKELPTGVPKKPPTTKALVPERHAFGEFGKVKLSQAEHESLVEKLGHELTATYIEAVDGWIAERPNDTKRKNRDCKATILNWHRRDIAEGRNRNPQPGGTPNGERPLGAIERRRIESFANIDRGTFGDLDD